MYKFIHSPNFNDRPKEEIIDTIIIHYTEISYKDTIEKFSNPKESVSSHFIINKDGEIIQMVDCEKRAWHAGVSSWKNKENINNNSIGIELVNNGNELFTEEQYTSLNQLIKNLKKKHPNMKEDLILGHEDIAPNRKKDPGKLFDWKKIKKI